MAKKDNIKENIVEAVNSKKNLFSELFNSDGEINIDDAVKAIKLQDIHVKSMGASILTLNKNNQSTSEQLKGMTSRLQKLFDDFQEVKKNTQNMANSREFSSNNIDEEELMAKIKSEIGEPDETLIRTIRKENRKLTRKLFFRGTLFFFLMVGLVAVNTLGLEKLKVLFEKKDFNSLSTSSVSSKKETPAKKSKTTTKKTVTTYIIPKDASFTCEGVDGVYDMPEKRELKGSIVNGYLNYKVNNNGATYKCKTKEFRKK